MRVQQHVAAKRGHNYPHRYRTGITATDRTQRWRPEMPEHQYVVQEDVTGQSKNRREHYWSCMAHSLCCESQRQENKDTRCAPGNGTYIAHCQIAEVRIDTEPF